MARNIPDFDQLTETWEPEMRRAFLDSVAQIQNRAKIKEITRLLERGDVDGVLDLIGIDARSFQTIGMTMDGMFQQAGIRFATSLTTSARVMFDVRNREAENWIRRRSSTLITEIVDDQRAMVRGYLQDGLARGDNPRTSAINLVGKVEPSTGRRVGGVIGLTTRQEQYQRAYAAEIGSTDPSALRNALKRGLRDKRFDRSILKAIRTGEPIPADIQSKMRAAYRNKMLKYRADVIARTETLQGLAGAEYEMYRQAIADGELQADQVTKVWKSASDARVRYSHRRLHNDEAPFLEPFVSPYGGRLRFPGDHQLGATAKDTVQCRCRLSYRVDYRAQTAEQAGEKLFEKLARLASNGGKEPGYYIIADRLKASRNTSDLDELVRLKKLGAAAAAPDWAVDAQTLAIGTARMNVSPAVRRARLQLQLLQDIQDAMNSGGVVKGSLIDARIQEAMNGPDKSQWKALLDRFFPGIVGTLKRISKGQRYGRR